MGTEVLVGGLWCGVLVYWLWTKRPSTADTVGSFHRELEVLERATPLRVAPANRLAAERQPGVPASLPRQVAVVAALHKQAELRRRRRDVLSLLAAATLVTLIAVVLSGSAVALAFQVCADLFLGGYVFLLYSATRSRGRAYAQALYLPEQRAALLEQRPAPAPPAARRPRARYVPAAERPYLVFAGRASATSTGPMPAAAPPPPARYGDFDSYERLALVEVR